MVPKPLNDKVIIEPEKAPEKVGNIHIPDCARQKSDRGKIVAVGPGGRTAKGDLVPMTLKAGDTVLFPMYSGQQIKVDGKDIVCRVYSVAEGACPVNAALHNLQPMALRSLSGESVTHLKPFQIGTLVLGPREQ